MGEAAAASSEGPADTLWEDWEDGPPRLPLAPELHLDGFDGPLDLLLDLVERERIDLRAIALPALIEQFVWALARLAHVPIERRADWLVLAARLVALRSRLLFPATADAARAAAGEATRAVERLEELRFLRAAACWLQARPQLGQEVFARPQSGPDPRAASYMALLGACLTLLEREEEAADANAAPDAASIYRPVTATLFPVPEALARIRAVLAELSEPAPLQAFLPRVADGPGRALQARSAVCSTFMGCLELARDGTAHMAQDLAFGTITVSRHHPADVAVGNPAYRQPDNRPAEAPSGAE